MPEILEVNDDQISDNVSKLKEEGNQHFKAGDLDKALISYTQALKFNKALDDKAACETAAALHRNRAAVHLKQEKWKKAELDCDKALEYDQKDPKSLYRRAQARHKMGNFKDAVADAKTALRHEPSNQAVKQLLRTLMEAIEKKKEESETTTNRLQSMLKLIFPANEEELKKLDPEDREKAIQNLLVLCRDSETGANLVWNAKLMNKLHDLVKTEKSQEVCVWAVRCMDQLIKKEERAFVFMEEFGFKQMVAMLNLRGSDWNEYVDSCAALIQRCFNALARMDRSKNVKPDLDFAEANKLQIVRLIIELEDTLVDAKVCARAREAAIDLLLKNLMHMDQGLPRGWSWKFVEDRGLQKMMQVACQIPEQCEFPVTSETRQHVAVCLARLWDDMVFDAYRGNYKDRTQGFLASKLEHIEDSKVQVQICALLITMLQGPVDVGFGMITNDLITNMMLEMAASKVILHQAIACELLVEMTGKRERATTIISSGMDVLKQLYRSEDESIKARALVGLCKCASSGGDDKSLQGMAEGSQIKLAQQCKKFLTNMALSTDVRRFSAEGLSYLAFDADVKDWVVQDNDTIRALVTLAKQVGPVVAYSVASLFVNLTNTYAKPKAASGTEEQMKKLAKFAKHHVPEAHPKDAEKYVKQRVALLVREGATSACFAISKTESKQCMDLLARCTARFTWEKEHRGKVVKEGGAKLLLRLALDAELETRVTAAQALARICITIEPDMAFPGQRMYEVVRPMIELLSMEVQYLENYEALLALTNLSGHSESLRKRILKEKPIPRIEEFWYDQQEPEIRAAAAELLLNLIHSEECFKMQLDETTDRLKLWALYAADEDKRMGKAACGALAMLTREPKACIRITQIIKDWTGLLKDIVTHGNIEAQYRGMLAVENMMDADYDVCAKIIQSRLFEFLVGISKQSDPKRRRAKVVAERCLEIAEKYDFIKASDRELYERKNQVSTVPEEKDCIITTRYSDSSDDDDEDI